MNGLIESFRLALSPAAVGDQGGQEAFDRFCSAVYRELNTDRMFDLLIGALDDENPTILREQSKDLDQIASWLAGMKSKANSFKRAQRRMYKAAKFKQTDLDRQVDLDSAANKAITLAELISDMLVCVQQRISLCQTMLNGLRQEEMMSRMGDS